MFPRDSLRRGQRVGRTLRDVGAASAQGTAVGGSGEPSGSRRAAQVLGAVLVAIVLPSALLWVLVGEFAAIGMFVGVLWGGVGAKLGGTRRMTWVAPAVGLAAGLGAFTAYDWWWVALLATSGLVAGAGTGLGWFAAMLMIPFAATFCVPLESGRNAVAYGVVVAIATLYGVALARRFGAPEVVEGERRPPPAAAVVAIVLGAVMGISAAIGVGLGWTEPYWVPEPVLILVLYVLIGKRDRIRGKAIGTSLGVATAIGVAIASPPAWMLTALGVAAFLVALTQTKTYWLMYGLYTFSLVLLLAAPGQVGFEAEERGLQILVGIGLLAVGLVVVRALGTWLSRREPQPELAPA
jgi:Fusaric acid resistance protein-like